MACDAEQKDSQTLNPEPADEKPIFVPELQQQVDQLGEHQEVFVMDEEGETFMVNEEGRLVSAIACIYDRCCRYTYVIDGVTHYKYYSLPVCPSNPAYRDVGPCPPCPPTN